MGRQIPNSKKKLKHPRNKRAKSARRQASVARKASSGHHRKNIGKLFEDLVAVQARLRAPGGCPWDREQTHHSLRTFLIEEAYEVLDAIEKGNPADLAEELGDLLLQVLFHADLGREAAAFDISDVMTEIRDKLIRRHPHVFGNVRAETPAEVLKNWAELKAREKQSSSGGVKNQPAPSVVDGIPRTLPALLEALQLTKRAAQVGFDWESVAGVIEKLLEEISELKAALKVPDPHASEEEVGDLIFSLVNLARFLELDPEVTLKHSNLKFKQRFQEMESAAARSGQSLSQLSKEALENLWESAKAKENQQVPAGSKS